MTRSRNAEEQNLIDTLAAGVARLASTDEWQAYLDVQAKFPAYSFANTMLIFRQAPWATRVMAEGAADGKNGWKSLGRTLKPGEKQNPIAIWAPSFRTVKAEDSPDGEDHRWTNFRPVPVYDVSQTEGADLPEPVKLLGGEAPEGALDQAVAFIRSLGYTVGFVDEIPGGANGHVIWADRLVEIATSGRSTRQQFKTALHEAGHILMGHEELERMDRGRKELEAESVAYVAAASLGVETDDYSFGYVLHWQGSDPARAARALKSSGKRIQQAAQKIVAGFEAVPQEQQEAA
jgi:hypothetical protein